MIQTILKTNNIIKVNPSDSLPSALGKLSASHDAAFVFDEKDQFLGVINPYHSVIQRSSFSDNTKVENALFHPPKLTLETPIKDAARLCIQTRIHYLPVFDNENQFIGIVSARRILKKLVDFEELNIPVSNIFNEMREPVVVNESEVIATALELLQDHKVSKILVINDKKKVAGIIAYYDLLPYLTMPIKRETLGERVGFQFPMQKQSVKKFMKSRVISANKDATLSEIAKMILEHGIGSVVIEDEANLPIALVTTRTIFDFLLGEKESGMIIEKVLKQTSPHDEQIVDQFLPKFRSFLEDRKRYEKGVILVHGMHAGDLYEVELQAWTPDNKKEFVKTEGRELQLLLTELKNKLKSI